MLASLIFRALCRSLCYPYLPFHYSRWLRSSTWAVARLVGSGGAASGVSELIPRPLCQRPAPEPSSTPLDSPFAAAPTRPPSTPPVPIRRRGLGQAGMGRVCAFIKLLVCSPSLHYLPYSPPLRPLHDLYLSSTVYPVSKLFVLRPPPARPACPSTALRGGARRRARCECDVSYGEQLWYVLWNPLSMEYGRSYATCCQVRTETHLQ